MVKVHENGFFYIIKKGHGWIRTMKMAHYKTIFNASSETVWPSSYPCRPCRKESAGKKTLLLQRL
jgi:hypothetical protein